MLKKENILKNGKYKLHLTVGMFNKLIKEGELKYVFTDEIKEYYLQQGGTLADIFKAFISYLTPITKKFLPAIGVATTSTLVSHGVNKALNKKKKTGGNMKSIGTKSSFSRPAVVKVVNQLELFNHSLH